MQVCHTFSARFDDGYLIATTGLVPVMALAESAGLAGLVTEHVGVPGSAGSHAEIKVPAVVTGMVAGADSISDMDLLHHGGMGRASIEGRAPTTVGTHLRAHTHGHTRQLDAIASRVLTGLAARVPGLLAGAEEMAYVDIDDTICETHGYAKQGVGYGYSGAKGLNARPPTTSLARRGGAAPIPASSGKTQRHRLNRGGDRRGNEALHRIALVRMRHDARTRAYVERRTAQN